MTPSVVWIAGASRSGSTLFGRLLGAAPAAVHVGEVTFLWERGLLENQLCGCGQAFRDCPFWNEVLVAAFGAFPSERQVREFVRLRTYSDYLPRAFLLAAVARRDSRVRAYSEALGALMKAIRQVSNARVVVDSSKRPSHGLLLTRDPSVSVGCIHLVRDSRAVCFSATRVRIRPEITSRVEYMPQGKPWREALRWDVHNALARSAGRHARRLVLVRYEDLAREPLGTANLALERLGLEPLPPDTVKRTGDGVATAELASDHSVSGNPMRFDVGAVEVRLDDYWRVKMPIGQRRIVTALSAPLLRKYGYDI